jgi:hypothetical protein
MWSSGNIWILYAFIDGGCTAMLIQCGYANLIELKKHRGNIIFFSDG